MDIMLFVGIGFKCSSTEAIDNIRHNRTLENSMQSKDYSKSIIQDITETNSEEGKVNTSTIFKIIIPPFVMSDFSYLPLHYQSDGEGDF